LVANAGRPERLGASLRPDGVDFALYSAAASEIFVSIFDHEGHEELARLQLEGPQDHVFFGHVEGAREGTRYGFYADGVYEPKQGLYFDPQKLLVDPYAKRLDRAFVHDRRLSLARGKSGDTARLVPKGIVVAPLPAAPKPLPVAPGGTVYEVNLRAFTMLHPGVPEEKRGTVAGLMEPVIVKHFVSLGINALELMPVAAWIDERHLPALGLGNAWGYNPIGFFAPDPRLMPGGIGDLRALCDLYREHDIAIIADVVFNHTGESDAAGAVLCLKGLDAKTYYRHQRENGALKLVNDTGCGNTLRCDHPVVQNLVLEALRYWAETGGVSGFRFDLAPVLGRSDAGFSPGAELLNAMRADPVVSDCLLIAEPWDPGPDGYQLGRFGAPFLEWNDKYRDDVRRFWRTDKRAIGALATRLAGSADIFEKTRRGPSAGVNFLAAHDGFTLYDLVSYARKHNEANGENNRDGHDDNLSWNNGVEGKTSNEEIMAARKADVMALLATLYFSRGTLMLAQGDELGRSQNGNNNAYAQDNAITWLDWENADMELAQYVGRLQKFRQNHPAISSDRFLSGNEQEGVRDVVWRHPDGREMGETDWHQENAGILGMHLRQKGDEVLIWFNRGHAPVIARLPSNATGESWRAGLSSAAHEAGIEGATITLPARSVVALIPAYC